MTRRFNIGDCLRGEAAAGLILMAAAALALLSANSPFAAIYNSLLAFPLGALSLQLWVNDGLMAIFFLLVGLEIKREICVGELSSRRRAALPAIAALGGMLVPALIYLAVTAHDPALRRGWAIPAATDIAFALGILALLGSRIPPALKVFLTALAILDDLGAILIIALAYTGALSLPALALAAGALLALYACNRLGLVRLWPYLLLGAVLWAATLASGIHATLAGVALAAAIPLRRAENSPLHRLEHRLHPWVAYAILPLFGFCNAGLAFAGLAPAALFAPLPLGIAAGLFFGKQLGVMAAAALAVRCGWAEWPKQATGPQIYGVSLLCGIGFTMSLFIGALAFPSAGLQNAVKLGVFAGSLLAGIAGYAVLRCARPAP